MMTLDRAYHLLCERHPARSFSLSVEVWRHVGRGADRAQIEWALYDVEDRVHYFGPSLENVMEQYGGCDADLAGVDARLRGFAPRARRRSPK
jgi:hypothetical protein